MPRLSARKIIQYILLLSFPAVLSSCFQNSNNFEEEKDGYDGPAEAAKFEFNRTKDPATGKVPRDKLMNAMRYTDSLKEILPYQLIAGYGNWTERGPNSDAVGGSNGNTRANNGVTSGRMIAMLVDAADATGN